MCFLLLFTLITVLCVVFFYTTKEQDKRQCLKTPLRNISAEKQTGDSHGVGLQSLIIDKCSTFTQIFLLWTECKRKQSQSSFLCFISLWCCCLNLLSFAGLARNKLSEKFTQLTEILVHGVTFQHWTLAKRPTFFITCLTFVWFPSVNRVKLSVSIVHFPFIKAVDEN